MQGKEQRWPEAMVLGQVCPVCSTNLCSHPGTCVYLSVKPQCHQPGSGIWRLVFLNETELQLFFSFKRKTPFSFSQASSSRTSLSCLLLPGSKMTSTQCSIFSLLVFIFIIALRLKTLFDSKRSILLQFQF